MKQEKTERLFLVLSVITLILAGGIYFIFGDMANVNSNENAVQPTHKVVSKNNNLSEAVDLIANAEKNPSKDAIEKAQKKLDKLKNTDTKKQLQKKLDQIKSDFETYEKAQKAVEETKNNPTTENKDLAQAAIDKVNDEKKKADLQSQLDAIVIIDTTVIESDSNPSVPATDTTVDAGQAPAESYIPQAPASAPIVPTTPAPETSAPATDTTNGTGTDGTTGTSGQ